ncbi:hypothetical protein CANARDRAFT_5665 [[Candida] arabinofermentans NRRL YB-2248]|uniref:BD-FAE-like domain-containing protein n=1 Tax=[Candida] arabinofermentans NRRL YB-2248 TaxID=983967 RepID=A0A1E4T5S3_9ASCO|nr:hypothetical protein CANARDRAFT_5665 [[Candida] arabinofermentans NRRL YB-2248]
MTFTTEYLAGQASGLPHAVKHFTLNGATDAAHQSNITPIVFIHGGAWVDPNNTLDDFDSLIEKIDSLTEKRVDLFSLEYRLSPQVIHPTHLLDVLEALHLIYSQYKVREVVIVGHSVGATLCSQIIDYKHVLEKYELEFTKQLPQIKSVVFLAGIYDVGNMLQDHPEYISFVEKAFNSENDWLNCCNMVQFNNFDYYKQLFQTFETVIVLYSLNDELLPYNGQPEHFRKWLEISGITNAEYISDDFGRHNDIYSHEKLAKLITDKFI